MQLRRREFLISMAAAGCLAMFCSPYALAAVSGNPKIRFALVSDTHLGKTSPQVMETVVQEINESPAEFTLFLGDLVAGGSKNENQYPQWVEIAKRLKKPWYAVPGNHDPIEFFVKYVSEKTDRVMDYKGYRFILFDDAHNPKDSHLGVVSPEQLSWITQRIDEGAQKHLRVILVAHIASHKNLHPDVGWWIRDESGGKEFNAMLEAKSATVVALFSGHFHCGMRGWNDRWGIHEVVIPAVAWNKNRGLGTAPGWSLDEFRQGYVLVDVYDDTLRLQYKPLSEEPKAVKELKLK